MPARLPKASWRPEYFGVRLGELSAPEVTNLVQHRPAFLKRDLVQHTFYTWTQTVDLNELDHQPVSRVEFGQLFWRGFAIDVEFTNLVVRSDAASSLKQDTYLFGGGKDWFQFRQKQLRTHSLIE